MKVSLTEKEINAAKEAVTKYKNLLEKEISFGDLMNIDNINSYAKEIKHQSMLIKDGYVII